jgi:hypothetical protein
MLKKRILHSWFSSSWKIPSTLLLLLIHSLRC